MPQGVNMSSIALSDSFEDASNSVRHGQQYAMHQQASKPCKQKTACRDRKCSWTHVHTSKYSSGTYSQGREGKETPVFNHHNESLTNQASASGIGISRMQIPSV